MLEIFIFLQKYVNLECKTWHVVITHVNTSNGIKIPTFFRKKLGDDVELVQCPFKLKSYAILCFISFLYILFIYFYY